MPHFFISHSDSEGAIACELVGFLRSQGFKVWVDNEGVAAGVNFVKDVELAIRGSEFLIVIWSVAATKLRWVQLEIDLSQSANKRIIPLLTGEDDQLKVLTDGNATRLSDPRGLSELKQLSSSRVPISFVHRS